MKHIIIQKVDDFYEVKVMTRDKTTSIEGFYNDLTMAKIHLMNICQAHIIHGIDFQVTVTCV